MKASPLVTFGGRRHPGGMRKITKAALAGGAAAVALAATMGVAAPAQAVGPGPPWQRGSGPDRGHLERSELHQRRVGGRYGGTVPITLCGHSATYTERGPFNSGRWIGVDPEMSGADAVACDLYVDGWRVVGDYADRGDGTDATCLVQI
jgi:hypothetical protein